MKTVFCTMLISNDAEPQVYKVDGNSTLESDKKVIFPVSGVLARTLQKGEKVKIVLFATENAAGDYTKYIDAFKEELKAINTRIGADIEYADKPIVMPFDGNRKTFDQTLRALIAEVKEDTQIIADITYGSKIQPILLFSALNFAEKYFNADIKTIIYGKVDFVPDPNNPDPRAKKIPKNPVIYDLTPLYYLNSLTNVIDCKSAADARKMLDDFFAL
ncbi:hypothetical protein FACS1894140_4990 [Spirochaetia bacterium]|nr:hypothetical protein FACS1894140_4990 [Spirochaetia bacterium]